MKTGLEKLIDSLGVAPTKDKIEYSCSQPVSRLFLLSVDRAGRPPTVGFPIVGKAVDRMVDWSYQTESEHSLSVDRTGRHEQTESSALSVGRSGRSTDVHTCTLVHVGRPLGRLTEQFCSAYGRSVSRLTKAKGKILKSFLNQSFSDKITFDL